MLKIPPIACAAAFLIAVALLTSGTHVLAATQESVLDNFAHTQDGALPAAALIFDSSGNLYGTTVAGGSDTTGTAFQLVPSSDGTWTENVLHSFSHTSNDGWQPEAGLALDKDGNLYGTTLYGGAYCTDQGGCGSVFELSPGSNGTWTEKLLHSFCARSRCADGNFPYGGVILDAAGNLYGTTSSGGEHNGGTVFAMTHSKKGWTENVLYSFAAFRGDGSQPRAELIFDRSGNLYGTTYAGGASHYGTVFELTPGAKGTWKESVLYSFTGSGADGANPWSALVMDAAGDLYGTTLFGGCSDYGCGTVFEMVMRKNGTRTEKVLFDLCTTSTCPGGSYPRGGVVLDSKNNLYGTTTEGGAYYYGTAFELTSDREGNWSETVLHSFPSSETDGFTPESALVLGGDGKVYGTTASCEDGNGSVFEISF